MRFCGKCGQGLPDGARFCTSCGTPAGELPGVAGPAEGENGALQSEQFQYHADIAAGSEPVFNPVARAAGQRSRFMKWTLVSILALVIAGTGFWGWQIRASQGGVQGKLDLAVKYLSEEKYDKAILAYNEAIRIDPCEVRAYQGLAKTYTLQGKYEEAKASYEKGLNSVADENKTVLKLGMAGLLFDKGDLSDAKQGFRLLLSEHSQLIDAYRGLASIYEIEGDIAGAQDVLETAVKYNPGNYQAYNALARLYQKNQDVERARDNLVKSLDLELNQAEAYDILADLMQGRWSQMADGNWNMKNPQTAAMVKFYALYADQQYPAAITLYNSALAEDQTNMKARALSAFCLLKNGDKTEAAQLIQGLQAMSINEWIAADIAEYYRQAGDAKLAVQWADKSLAVNRDNLAALRVLAAIYSDISIKSNQKMARLTASQLIAYSIRPVKVIVNWLTEHNINLPLQIANPDIINVIGSGPVKTTLKESNAQIISRLKGQAIYQYEMRDGQGQVYDVFIYADDVKTRLADGVDVVQTVNRGDVLKTGHFQVGYIERGSDELKAYRGEYFAEEHTFDVTAFETRFFRNMDANQPDLLLVGEPASSQAYMFHIYSIINGQWTLVRFESQGKVFDSTAAQSIKGGPAFIQVGSDQFESGLHNNAGPEGESLDVWRLDPKQNVFHFVTNRKVSFDEWRTFMGF